MLGFSTGCSPLLAQATIWWSTVSYSPLCASHSRRLRRLGCFAARCFAADCFAALSASLTCAYWKYLGSGCITLSFLEGVLSFITRRLKIRLGYVDNLIVFRLNKSMNSPQGTSMVPHPSPPWTILKGSIVQFHLFEYEMSRGLQVV